MDDLRASVERRIREAFAGVTLGDGTSLRQGEVSNNCGRGFTPDQWAALPLSEVTDDWSRVPQAELERHGAIPHLDGEGLRYYLPALLLSLLEHYDSAWTMWMIGTMMAIAPRKEHLKTDIWLHYSHLSEAQKSAIAVYVQALPQLVHLRADDAISVRMVLRDYWAQFLPREPGRKEPAVAS